MALQFLSNADYDGNQIMNISLERLSADPITGNSWAGRVIYNSTSNSVKYFNGTAWVELGAGQLTSILNGGAINVVVSGTTVTLTAKVDNLTTEIAADAIQVKDLGIGTAKLADNAVTTVKVTDKSITFAKIQDIPTMTVIGRTAGGSGVASAISVITAVDLSGASNANLATAGAIKSYVDGRISAIGSLVGGFNASTATQLPGGAGVAKGSYWYVTNPGTVQGITFNVGDVLIANKADPSPTLAADWIALESNRDKASTTILGFIQLATVAEAQAGTDAEKAITPATLASVTATETRSGLVELATVAEATTGTDTQRAVTPAGVKAVVVAEMGTRSASFTIGNGTDATYVVTHNMGTLRTHYSVWNTVTSTDVYVEVERTANTLTLKFAKAVPTNRYAIAIWKG